MKWFRSGSGRIFRTLISLKFAVILILTLALSSTVGTVLESKFDTRTAGYWVYKATWFHLLLLVLFFVILFVALSRWPWKRRHLPFLMAHLGILILLVGSWMTQKFGVDANMAIGEGQSTAVVESVDTVLYVRKKDQETKKFPIRWVPPHSEYRPMELDGLGLKVSELISHAEQVVRFGPKKMPTAEMTPAIHINVSVPRAGIARSHWLWAGDSAWKLARIGPAIFQFRQKGAPAQSFPGQTILTIFYELDAKKREMQLSYVAQSRTGDIKKGKIDLKNPQIQTGWGKAMGGISINLETILTDAENQSVFVRARNQYGSSAPPPAIQITSLQGHSIWLGQGDRARVAIDGVEHELIHVAQREILPFAIGLERFSIEYNEGTRNPAAYSSLVRVKAKNAPQESILISMNEPLKFDKYTFYQSSYIPGEPRPTTTVLTVNYDPGRFWKYLGSLLIVLGSILLFWDRNRKASK